MLAEGDIVVAAKLSAQRATVLAFTAVLAFLLSLHGTYHQGFSQPEIWVEFYSTLDVMSQVLF